jgi:hypothetical protein
MRKTYTDDWEVPTKYFTAAEGMMSQHSKENLEFVYTSLLPSTVYYTPRTLDLVPKADRQPMPAI